MTSYTFKYRKGIDDLHSLYAFSYEDIGGGSRTNSIEEYLNSGGWLSFNFKCPITEEAIAEEIERRKLWNANYIDELTAKGEYGEEVECYLSMEDNPLFDSRPESDKSYPLESYTMVFLDVSEK